MKLTHLVWREIAHRKLNFLLTLLSVVVAVSCAVSVVTVLRAYRLAAEQRVAALDDDIRKIMKNMGFNILILPEDENLAEFYAADFAAKTMPEDYVQKLADRPDIMTINHLRPALIRKVDWVEQNRQIILMGVRGVVPFAHRVSKAPLADPVPTGMIDVGHVLANELNLKSGDMVTLLTEDFQVNKVYPARGNKDDISVWIDLAKAQQMLRLEGRINLIQALECNCASVNRLAEIESEVSGVLGDVQVVEIATTAIARAKTRTQVAEDGNARVQRWRQLAAMLIPLVAVAAAVVTGLLALSNVRQRRQEIGILRALGMRSQQILLIFLTKSALIGFLGAALGYLGGLAVAWAIKSQGSGGMAEPEAQRLFILTLALVVTVITPLVTVLAGWLPALAAAEQDPTKILHEE